MSGSPFKFDLVVKNIEHLKKELPVILANEAQNYFAGSWQKFGLNGGWDGKEWQTPNRRIPGTKEYNYPKSGLQRTRATLVKSGALRRAVQDCIKSATFDMIQLVVAIPYAQYHNDGTSKLPKRQFIGQTAELSKMQKEKIDEFINKTWQV